MELNRIIHSVQLLTAGVILTSCIEVNGSGYSDLSESEKLHVKKTNISRKGTTWKETCYPLPKGTTVPSNVLESLHADYPDFTYTEVSIVEKPDGIVYLFTDGNRPDRLGHYVEAN